MDKQFYPSIAPRESMGRFKEKGGRVREKDDATRKDRFGERHFMQRMLCELRKWVAVERYSKNQLERTM